MFFKSFCIAVAALPLTAFAGNKDFDGNYSIEVGAGPLKDLYVLSVAGNSGTMTFAKALQKPDPAQPVVIEQAATRMKVRLSQTERTFVFEKSETGLTCVSGCSASTSRWDSITQAKQVRTAPSNKVDFDSLPMADLGNLDGAWIRSKLKSADPDDPVDVAFEIKGEFVKLYYYQWGLYPVSRTPEVYMLKGSSFIAPNSGNKLLELRKVSDSTLAARYPQKKEVVYLYRAKSIQFSDLKQARKAAES